ncbi:hypothetical protein T12_16506, partial [Trichinella patagoniensis]
LTFLGCHFMDVAGSHPNIRHLPQYVYRRSFWTVKQYTSGTNLPAIKTWMVNICWYHSGTIFKRPDFVIGVESPAAGELEKVLEIFVPVFCTSPFQHFYTLETDQQFPNQQMHCSLLRGKFAEWSSIPPLPVA